MTVYTDTLTEGIGCDPDVGGAWRGPRTASDTVTGADALVVGHGITASDTVGSSDAARYDYGVLMSEIIGITEQMLGPGIYPRTLGETIRVAEAVVSGLPITLAETVSVSDVMTAVTATTVLETLGLTEAFATTNLYHYTVAEGVGVADAIARYFSGVLLDYINVQDTPVELRKAPATASDGIGVARSVTPSMVFRVIAADEVEFDAEATIRAILTGAITDALEISAAYVGPNGNFTTWAINTNTGAVSEYDNFVFNSFARVGNKYLGANSDGVYELVGDDDDGSDIVAHIKSGLLQFGGARLTSFKGVYLATRGGGDYVLKIETGEGRTYTYNVKSNSMQTAKVQVGKGLRARYFSYELISTGQDFDLESLEFVPIVASRRV